MGQVVPSFLAFRESHHAIARWFAMGLTISEVCNQTGYTRRRLRVLLQDPTFQELIVTYHEGIDDETRKGIDAYKDMYVKNMLRAEAIVTDYLDDEENPPSLSLANKISQDRADRAGYSKHSTIKHEHSFADLLEKAIARSDRAKVIEARPVAVADQPPVDAPVAAVEPRPSFTRVLKRKV